MNNKGMAITTVIYSIILLLSLCMFLVLGILRSEYTNDKQYILDLREELNDWLKKDDGNFDTSGANKPILASNMIPVYYDEINSVWKKADKNNKATTVTYRLGDVNGDGLIDAADLQCIYNIVNGYYFYSQTQKLAADVDGDGKVTENDKNLLTRYVANISSADFPAGAPLEEKTGTIINRWYSYESSGENKGMWANVVTVTSDKLETYKKAEIDTTISMDDITTMWVWIPRFNAITPSNYNGGTKEKPNAINVTFVKPNETAIDAFTFGTKQLSGFWYGKFEVGGTLVSSCTNETCNVSNIVVKPNVASLKNQQVSSFFYASRSMEQTGNSFGFISSEVDTHMSKNNEWGAVAYLTQSIYGRCTTSTLCTEIGKNNNNNLITGYGAPAGSDKTVANGAYNTTLGKDASTTKNIYGVYDMSGGCHEYIMGVLADSSGRLRTGYDTSQNSGFTGILNNGTTYTGVSFPDSKYYNLYTGASYKGHALTETAEWYNDSAYFFNSSNPWFIRGGRYTSTGAGIFFFGRQVGKGYIDVSSRFVITNE